MPDNDTNRYKKLPKKQLKTYDNLPLEKQFEKGKSYTAWVLSRSAKTTKELRTKLARKKMSEDVIDALIDWAEEYGYINDENYTVSFMKEYMGRQGKTEKWTKMRLTQKGINEETYRNALNTIQETTQIMDEASIQNNITKLSDTAMRRLRNETDPYKKQRKFTNQLLRAGYTYQDIRKAWERATEGQEND